MKNLTLSQLKKWKPCNGQDWVGRFQKEMGKSAEWDDVLKVLIKEKEYSAVRWLIGKRLEELSKRKVCAFAYRCSHRALKYARKQDLEVLEKAISFAKVFAETGKVDVEAAWSAARSVAWSAWSARSAADSADWSAWSARSAAESAARSAWSARSAAESAARSVVWSARSAAWLAEYKWQFIQLLEIEGMKKIKP